MAELMERRRAKLSKRLCRPATRPMAAALPTPSFPALRGSAIAVGDMTGLIDIVVNGKRGTAMQAFGRSSSNEVEYCGDHHLRA